MTAADQGCQQFIKSYDIDLVVQEYHGFSNSGANALTNKYCMTNCINVSVAQ